MTTNMRTFQGNNDSLTFTDNSISVTAQPTRDETFFAWKEFGKDTVNKNFDFTISSSVGVNLLGLLSYGDDVGDSRTLQFNTYFGLYYFGGSGDVKLKAVSDGVLTLSTGFVISIGTPYYCTITKAGLALECKIYSDSGRTTLLSTEALTAVLDDSYKNEIPLSSYNNDSPSVESVSATISNIVDLDDTFSIKSHAQKTGNATVDIAGVSPASATVAWTGTGGATSGNTTADGSGDWVATVTLGSDAENVLTFTTSGETNQEISVTQGAIDFTLDSAVIDTTGVGLSTYGPCKSDVNYDGEVVIPTWILSGSTKTKLGRDSGSGLAFSNLQTVSASGDPTYLASFNDVLTSYHMNTLFSGDTIQNGFVEDDYSAYTNMSDPYATTVALDIVSGCINSLNRTYIAVRSGNNYQVRWSVGTLHKTANAYVDVLTSIATLNGDYGTAQVICNANDDAYFLVGERVDEESSILSLKIMDFDTKVWASEVVITSELPDFKFFQAVKTSDNQIRIFYLTLDGDLKCKTVSSLGVVGSEVSILSDVQAFTATAINSQDDYVQLGITKAPYLLLYDYKDGVLDTIPVQIYDDIEAGTSFVTSPTIEPVTVPFMFQNLSGYMTCATVKHPVVQRSTSGEFIGVGRKAYSAPVINTHQEAGFDKSVFTFGAQDDWDYIGAWDWLLNEIESVPIRVTSIKHFDYHNSTKSYFSPLLSIIIMEGGRRDAYETHTIEISESDNVITDGADVNVTDFSLLSPQPNIGTDASSRGYKDSFVDSSGNTFIVHMISMTLYIEVLDAGSWTRYTIYDNAATNRMYWQGSRIDSNDDIHIGVTSGDDNTIPLGANGSVNSVRLDYLKLTYTGSGFTAAGADGSAITLPCLLTTADNVIVSTGAITEYSPTPSSLGDNPALTTSDMLYIGYLDKRSMELDSLNNPIFAAMTVGVLDFEDVKGIYTYRWTGAAWAETTVSTDADLATVQPQLVKSQDGDSLICIYNINTDTHYKVSDDGGATYGAQKTLFSDSYATKNLYPVASSRGLDIISEKHIDPSYTEIVLESVQFAFGNVQITIEDDLGNPVVGATYSMDGEGTYTSGQLVPNILVGDRLISFSEVVDYTKPIDLSVSVTDGGTATDTGVYISTAAEISGGLQVGNVGIGINSGLNVGNSGLRIN